MKIVLTDISGKELVVDSDSIKFFEPASDASGAVIGTHIVFGADMGRVVQESTPSIASILGVVSVPTSKAAMVADVAKGKKK